MIFLQKKGAIHGEIGEIYISRYDRLNDEGSNKLNKRITPCEMKRLDNLKITWDSDRTLKLGDPYMNFPQHLPIHFCWKVSIFIKSPGGWNGDGMPFYGILHLHSLGGEADTVEVSVSRDEVSGFLRLTLSNCKQVVVPGGSRWEGIFCWEHGDDFWGCWCFFLNRRIIKGGCLCHVFFVGGGGGFDIM